MQQWQWFNVEKYFFSELFYIHVSVRKGFGHVDILIHYCPLYYFIVVLQCTIYMMKKKRKIHLQFHRFVTIESSILNCFIWNPALNCVIWSIIFQEAIKENSVTMNKMRLLKNRMESQKNLKVLTICIFVAQM